MPRYDAQTALLVVDVQNDFADPGGALSVAGGVEVVSAANGEIAQALQAGAFVVYTQDWHPPDTPHFAKDGGIWPVHCVRDTWGAALHPQLHVDGPIVRKGTHGEDGYSGFTMRDPLSAATVATELAASLHERSIERVVVVGLATDYCVKESALDAIRLAWEVHVVSNAIRAVDLKPGDGARALDEMRAAGASIA